MRHVDSEKPIETTSLLIELVCPWPPLHPVCPEAWALDPRSLAAIKQKSRPDVTRSFLQPHGPHENNEQVLDRYNLRVQKLRL